MIRVGFLMVQTDSGWVGGLNYLNNLTRAILAIEKPAIEPVILTTPDVPATVLKQFAEIEIVKSPLLSTGTAKLARRIGQRILGCDFLLELLLKRHRISVLSHSDYIGCYSNFPVIGWVPDFQHVRLPEFFQAGEIANRDAGFNRLINCSRTLVLSSYDAQKDFAQFAPLAVRKSRVLQFVSLLPQAAGTSTLQKVRGKYCLDGEFFFLPNQFWAHKNHRVVIDALGILKSRNRRVTVIATGQTADRRQPQHFDDLMRHSRLLGVEDDFRVLGLVPLEDLFGLMTASVAVINPSLFEGWSTTVEEGKSLGKKMILSDISVHREQAPERAIYFSAREPTELADALFAALSDYSVEDEVAAQARAEVALPRRAQLFGEFYQDIVLETVNSAFRRGA